MNRERQLPIEIAQMNEWRFNLKRGGRHKK